MFYRVPKRAISPIQVFCRGVLLKTRIFRSKDENAISNSVPGPARRAVFVIRAATVQGRTVRHPPGTILPVNLSTDLWQIAQFNHPPVVSKNVTSRR